MRKYLLTEFNNNGYKDLLKQNNKLSQELHLATLENGTSFTAVYPGLKSGISRNKIKYDYRVDIHKQDVTVTLSHVNIIVDLYKKIHGNNGNRDDFLKMLGNLYRSGNSQPLQGISDLSHYQSSDPIGPTEIEELHRIHREIGKRYHEPGNQWDLEIEELYTAIVWIALQEDINYPQEEGYEGRRMPFKRYIEAVEFAARNQPITLIIHRALQHNYRPKDFTDVDYSILR